MLSLGFPERIRALAVVPSDRFAAPVKRDALYSVFSLTEHAMLCLTERIHAALDGFAIPVSRDPL